MTNPIKRTWIDLMRRNFVHALLLDRDTAPLGRYFVARHDLLSQIVHGSRLGLLILPVPPTRRLGVVHLIFPPIALKSTQYPNHTRQEASKSSIINCQPNQLIFFCNRSLQFRNQTCLCRTDFSQYRKKTGMFTMGSFGNYIQRKIRSQQRSQIS